MYAEGRETGDHMNCHYYGGFFFFILLIMEINWQNCSALGCSVRILSYLTKNLKSPKSECTGTRILIWKDCLCLQSYGWDGYNLFFVFWGADSGRIVSVFLRILVSCEGMTWNFYVNFCVSFLSQTDMYTIISAVHVTVLWELNEVRRSVHSWCGVLVARSCSMLLPLASEVWPIPTETQRTSDLWRSRNKSNMVQKTGSNSPESHVLQSHCVSAALIPTHCTCHG